METGILRYEKLPMLWGLILTAGITPSLVKFSAEVIAALMDHLHSLSWGVLRNLPHFVPNPQPIIVSLTLGQVILQSQII